MVLLLLERCQLQNPILLINNVTVLQLRLDGGVGTVYDEIQVDDAHHLSAGLPSDDGLVAIKQIRLSYNDFIDYSSIYVMSSRLVKKLPLFNCQQYSTCNDCLQSNDPFCGWCTLQSRWVNQTKVAPLNFLDRIIHEMYVCMNYYSR